MIKTMFLVLVSTLVAFGSARAAIPANAEAVTVRQLAPGITLVSEKTAGLGDDVVLQVPQLAALVKSSADTGQPIALFLDGMPIRKVGRDVLDTNKNHIGFRLERTEESKGAWKKLLGNPMWYWARPVPVSLGLENGSPLPSEAKIELIIIKRWGLFLWVGLVLIVLTALVKYGRETAALRAYDATSPYSLAQVQMASWFFMVISSYSFIYLVTGDMNNIPDTILILLGISVGTTFGARMIDQTKVNAASSNSAAEVAAIEAKIKTCESLPPEEASKQKADLESQLNAVKAKQESKSQGFWKDILTDSYGTSLHRLQSLVWTVVLAFIFGRKVYLDLAMPEFNNTLLALMGISSGTYLGFKIPEQK